MRDFFADNAWLPHGWESNVRIGVDGTGAVAHASDAAERGDAEYLGRFVLPAMPNVHSHAFQRAMAGLAERQTDPKDSFWTWRETMYAFAGRVDPDSLRAIAAQLYVEMLKAGYTHVCEFHYLHHQPNGDPYADPAEMSLALVEAAKETGIGLTLMPTLYITGGFDGRALSERQKRFGHSVDSYLALLEKLRKVENASLRIGIALHSLRAVPEAAMHRVLTEHPLDKPPVHIHVAEQIGEVQDCLAVRNARPVEWLLDHAPVDDRWCLVHATHVTEDELRGIAQTGAVAGLCPTTEANLGDGVFPLKAFLNLGGAIAVGSDSHISVSPVEELRWLEYGQRLATRHRNIGASRESISVGENLFRRALDGGARASGADVAALADDSGKSPRADFVVLDDASPILAGRDTSHVIDTWLFAGNTTLVKDVMVAGDWVVRDFRHRDEERIAGRYRAVVGGLVRAV